MKKIFSILLALAVSSCLFTACNLDIAPADSLTGEQMTASPSGLEDILNGCYATMKDDTDESNYWWGRQYYQLADFASDDVVYGHETSDDLNMIFRYDERSPVLGNFRSFWALNYKLIYSCNVALATIAQKEELTEQDIYLRGEAEFFKAFCMHALLKNYAKQFDPATANSDLGIILREDSSDSELKDRATVAESYDAIIDLLLKAEQDFSAGSFPDRESNKGFASLGAAQAMLSRVYIFTQDWQKAAEYATKVINSGDYALESAKKFPSYFTETYNRDETIWCMRMIATDDQGSAAVASMIYNGASGCWGEEGYSKPLLDDMNFEKDQYIDVDCRFSFVCPAYLKNGLILYPCSKHTWQDGIATLCSHPLLRLAEVYLNRAEAYAHLNNEAGALADLNTIIDSRMDYDVAASKGYSPADYHLSSADIKTNLVDLVLTQKRIELAFEGFRIYDLLRNKKDVIRNYWGFHTNYVNGQSTGLVPGLTAPGVTTKYDYGRLICPIPQQEILNNPACTQNEAYK